MSTTATAPLAPQSTISSSTTAFKPARTPHAPPKGSYLRSLGNLRYIPNRLLHPGQRIERELEAKNAVSGRGGEKFNGATAGVVRGARIKLCDVQLEDVLAGKMTPPISLKDFEDFLCFRTKSAENLYFEMWFRAYSNLYNQATPSSRNHRELLALQDAYRMAVDVFFSARSPLELNLPADVRRQLDDRIEDVARTASTSPAQESILPPDAFAAAHHDSSESLATSFKAFLQQAARNADRNRGWFAISLGALTWALGLIPTIVCAVLDKPRGWRCLGLPLWWFGVVVLVGGLKRTCLVIYMFGDNRQLYPWELARDADDGSSYYGISNFNSPTLVNVGAFDDVEGGKKRQSSDLATESRRNSTFSFPDMHYFPLPHSSASISEKSTTTSSGRSGKSSTTPSGLYFAPAAVDLPKSSRVWAPFCKQISPIVARAQRGIVLAAAGYGLLAMVITAAICLAVPNRRT